MAARQILTVILFIISLSYGYADIQPSDNSTVYSNSSIISIIQERLDQRFNYLAVSLTNWLEKMNDRHLANSTIGRIMHYGELKPRVARMCEDKCKEKEKKKKKKEKEKKKRELLRWKLLVPLLFHVGACCVWMFVNTLINAKLLAVSAALLLFKLGEKALTLGQYLSSKGKSPQVEFHHHDSKVAGHDAGYGYGGEQGGGWDSYSPQWGAGGGGWGQGGGGGWGPGGGAEYGAPHHRLGTAQHGAGDYLVN